MPEESKPRKARSLEDLGLGATAAHEKRADLSAQSVRATTTFTPEYFAELERKNEERRLNQMAELNSRHVQRMYETAAKEHARQEEHMSLQRRTAAAAEGALDEARARAAEMEERAVKAEAEAASSARQARIANLFACGSLVLSAITYFLSR